MILQNHFGEDTERQRNRKYIKMTFKQQWGAGNQKLQNTGVPGYNGKGLQKVQFTLHV